MARKPHSYAALSASDLFIPNFLPCSYKMWMICVHALLFPGDFPQIVPLKSLSCMLASLLTAFTCTQTWNAVLGASIPRSERRINSLLNRNYKNNFTSSLQNISERKRKRKVQRKALSAYVFTRENDVVLLLYSQTEHQLALIIYRMAMVRML